MSGPRHPFLIAYLDSLRAAGKGSTATTYAGYLARCEDWLDESGIDASQVTTAQLRQYQRWLFETCRRRDGQPLATTTLATCIIVVKSAYAWLFRQGRLLVNPAAVLVLPKRRTTLVVAKEHLSQQEAHALIETAAALVAESPVGASTWARHSRNLALIALSLSTGRRCLGLVSLRLEDINLERSELRVAIEKGRMGRVLPVADWAVEAVRRYLDGPRQFLLGGDGQASPWLFVSQSDDRLCARGFAFALDVLVAETARRNPDLFDLPGKRISTHSLRVTFAKLMHDHGCSIRSLNELMLHRSLSTTAAYTPLSVEDLRTALLSVHPRA